MGRDSISICRTCGVFQANGYGSYSTWLDYETTLAAYDAQAAKEPNLAAFQKNKNARAFLVEHDGHAVEWTSSDCWYHDDDSKIMDGLQRRNAAGFVGPDDSSASATPPPKGTP